MVTGFQSPATGYEDKTVNLNTLLVQHPNATVFMQIDTTKYMKNGIYNGDLLVIDRAKAVKANSLVVYAQNGQFQMGRFKDINRQWEAVITGVIVHVIHTVKDDDSSC